MKKLFCIALSIALVLVSFCACSKSEPKTEVEEQSVELKYTYDTVYSAYDSNTINSYQKVCEAIVKGEGEATIDTQKLNEVNQLVYTSFPLYPLVESIAPNPDGYGVAITYKNDINTHKDLVKKFADKVNSIVKECKNGATNKAVYVVNAYHYVATNIAEISDESITSYDAIMTGKGNSFTFSNMFEYILLQNDIEACHIIAEDASGKSYGMSASKINDAVYFFDVTGESYSNSGNGLTYFAMNTKDVEKTGVKKMTYTNKSGVAEVKDDSFGDCRISKSFKVENDTLIVTLFDDSTKEISLLPQQMVE